MKRVVPAFQQPGRACLNPSGQLVRRVGLHLHVLWLCAFAGFASLAAAQEGPTLEAQIAAAERRADRHPTRALREVEALLSAHPQLAAAERLRLEVVRLEAAAALESAAEALARIDAQMPALRAHGEPRLLAKALLLRARMLDFLGRGADALEDSRRGATLAEQAGDAGLQVEILVERAGLLVTRSEFQEAFAAFEQAERLARSVSTHRVNANVAYFGARLAAAIGDRAGAVTSFRRAVDAYRADQDPSNAADSLVGLGLALLRDRRAAEALAPLDEAVRLFTELEDERGVAVAESPRAVALAFSGRTADALRASDRALAILRPYNAAEEMRFALLNRAQMANLLTRPRLALAAIEEARPLLAQSENMFAQIALLRESAAALAALGRYREAHAALTQLREREESHRDLLLQRQLAAQRGRIESARLEHDNLLLRREAEANRQALQAARHAARLQTLLAGLGGVVLIAALAGLWHQRGLNRRIAELAATDHLTGTLNRRRLLEVGQQAIDRGRRRGDRFAVLLLDLDHFKAVNDRNGHAAGDKALKLIAAALKRELRDQDVLGRYGGEEFAAILPDTSAAEAVRVAERLRAAVAALPPDAYDAPAPVTLSGGVAVSHPGDANIDAVIERADRALYRAKESGRNRIELAPAPEPATLRAVA